ncbi:MAG: PilZ domain-containing protein [Deltaproteobacteria bacterium]|nr:PilZ domain-containing protein [Deltaproteobacteria bacterium]
MDEAGEEQIQRREYSRVDVYIPFDYRIVADDEKCHIQARISGNTATSDIRPVQNIGDYDYIFGEWLQILNAKLDTIIRLMTLQREGYFGLPFKTINISGGGMSFLLTKPIPLGEILEIKIMLTWNQPVAMSVYGEITKSEKQLDKYFTAVRYVHMDSSVRDEIIRFVFEREREIIREKRR